jgi:orotate phosphoribosyltransferase
LTTDQVIETFKKSGALLEGHFKLTSGLHSSVYLQCALVLQFPEKAEAFARAIADQYEGKQIELVASPAIGGLIIGHEVARALGARFIWTERQGRRNDFYAADSQCARVKRLWLLKTW